MIDGYDIEPPYHVRLSAVGLYCFRNGRFLEFRKLPPGGSPQKDRGILKFSLQASCEYDAKCAIAYLALITRS